MLQNQQRRMKEVLLLLQGHVWGIMMKVGTFDVVYEHDLTESV